MEKIIRNYGAFLLGAVVAVCLLLILFCTITDTEGNKGIFKILGAHLKTEETNSGAAEDFFTVDVENQVAAPIISFEGSQEMFYVGEIEITKYFRAVDGQGTELPVKVLKVENPKGEDVTEMFCEGTGVINFALPGIYQMTVWALDKDNRKSISSIALPVNQ